MWYFCPFAVSFYSGSMCGCPIFRNAYRIADYVAVGEARTEGYTLVFFRETNVRVWSVRGCRLYVFHRVLG